MGRLLTPAQLAQFETDGAVVLKGLLDPNVVASWRDQYWAGLSKQR
eukprot:COSAG05_NODE_24215_length_253_cov_0.649351_1_plen_45_part_01